MNMTPNERARQRLDFVRAQLGPDAPEPVSASSDAGFRSYWRTQDAAGCSLIVMDCPPGLDDPRPWLRIRQVLKAGGVRVPAVLSTDTEAGFLLMEDLGGPTLLQTITPATADTWFAHAIEQLVRIQRIPVPRDLPDYDAALVQRELALFPDWFLGRHLGLELSELEQAGLQKVCARLETAFLGQTQVLVHRDFMPRNLMPMADDLAVLDFQDAVRGPLAYDVISLFKDAFLSWPQTRIDTWVAEYRRAALDAGLPVPDADTFRRDLDYTGIQRHLKVLGIFARLQHRDHKPRYLADAARFLGYLDTTLPAYPELAALHGLLQRRVFPLIAPLDLPS